MLGAIINNEWCDDYRTSTILDDLPGSNWNEFQRALVYHLMITFPRVRWELNAILEQDATICLGFLGGRLELTDDMIVMRSNYKKCGKVLFHEPNSINRIEQFIRRSLPVLTA